MFIGKNKQPIIVVLLIALVGSAYLIISNAATGLPMKTSFPHAFALQDGTPVKINGVNIRNVGEFSANTICGGGSNGIANWSEFKTRGFNTVRLAVNWPSIEPNQGVLDSTGLSKLDDAVNTARNAGLFVILDPIHLQGVDGNLPQWVKDGSGGNSIEKIKIYAPYYLKQIAQRYKNDTNVIGIDLVNEPHPNPLAFDQNKNLDMFNTLINEVRTVDSSRILIIEPQTGDSSWNGVNWGIIQNKSNLVISHHSYFAAGANSAYSSSGWASNGASTSDGYTGYDNPNATQIANHYDEMLGWANSQNLPLYIGEFGIGKDATNRDLWIEHNVQALNDRNIPRTWWEGCSNGTMALHQNSSDTWLPFIDLLKWEDTTTPPPTSGTCPVWSLKGNSNAVGMAEASGLIASRNQPGIFWTHNDSGGTNQIWAIDSTGKIVSRHVLNGASAGDWEDISFGPGPDPSKDYIYVGDIGTKNRSAPHVIYRVPEPTVNPSDNNAQYSISSSLLNSYTINFQLANGNSKKPDIEGMAVDPLTNDIYMFDKELNLRDQNGVNGMSYVFRVDGSGLNANGTYTAYEIANVVGNVDSQSANTYPPGGTGADISADGQMIVMQNYEEVFIWHRNGGTTFVDALNAPSDGRAPCYYTDADIAGGNIPGSEAVTFSPDAKELSFLAEGSSSAIRTFEDVSSPTDPPGNDDNVPLTVPTNLQANPGDGKVTLTWTASTDTRVDEYSSQYRPTGTSTWTYGGRVSGTTQELTGLTNGTAYEFRIHAINNDVANNLPAYYSPYTSAVTATPQAPASGTLGAVTNIQATAGNGQVVLTWNTVANANNYTVRWGTGGSYTTYSNDLGPNPTTNTYTVTGLTNGTTYNFSIAARDSSGTYTNGPYSAGVNATPQNTTTTKPGDSDGDNDVDLTDLARLLTDYGKTGTYSTDFNGNGQVDLTDLAILLSNYGK